MLLTMSEKAFSYEDNIFSLLLPKNETNIISQQPVTYSEEELENLLSEQIKYLMVKSICGVFFTDLTLQMNHLEMS
jgi:hypothetical protein